MHVYRSNFCIKTTQYHFNIYYVSVNLLLVFRVDCSVMVHLVYIRLDNHKTIKNITGGFINLLSKLILEDVTCSDFNHDYRSFTK